MRKRILCMLLIVMLMIVGCKSTNPADYTTPPLSPGSDNIPPVGLPPNYSERNPEYHMSYTEYCSRIDTTYTGPYFIHFDDIAFSRDFYSYAQDNQYGKPETMHTNQHFAIIDGSGKVRTIRILREYEPSLKPQNYRQMPDVENYLYVPKPESVSSDTRFYSYRAGNAVYTYYGTYGRGSNNYEDFKGMLAYVKWTYLNCTIIVYSFEQAITEECGFFYDLMDPENAQSAINRFNSAVLLAYARNIFVIWAPIIIPLVCIAAAGAIYLIIRRRRKKAADKKIESSIPQKEAQKAAKPPSC